MPKRVSDARHLRAAAAPASPVVPPKTLVTHRISKKEPIMTTPSHESHPSAHAETHADAHSTPVEPPRAYPRLRWNPKTGAEATVHSPEEEQDHDKAGFTSDTPKPPDPGLPGGPVKVAGELTFQAETH